MKPVRQRPPFPVEKIRQENGGKLPPTTPWGAPVAWRTTDGRHLCIECANGDNDRAKDIVAPTPFVSADPPILCQRCGATVHATGDGATRLGNVLMEIEPGAYLVAAPDGIGVLIDKTRFDANRENHTDDTMPLNPFSGAMPSMMS